MLEGDQGKEDPSVVEAIIGSKSKEIQLIAPTGGIEQLVKDQGSMGCKTNTVQDHMGV